MQADFYKIDLYAKDPFEAKYQLLINKPESTDLKHLNDTKVFIEYSNDMDCSDCNWTQTQNHLVRKGTLNHLAKLDLYL